MTIVSGVGFVLGLAMLASGTAVFAEDSEIKAVLDRMVAAYPDELDEQDGKDLRWRDGTLMREKIEAILRGERVDH